MSKDKTTPAEEVKKTDGEAAEEVKETEETSKEGTEGTKTKTEAEPTVEELLTEEKDDSVPLSTFLETKKEKKALEKELSELKAKKEEGATNKEVKADLRDIADKYDVDPKFLGEISEFIYAKAQGSIEDKLNSKLQPLEAKEKQAKINEVFNANYDKVMADMPEYADVVNKEVIKQLVTLPENSKKTFQQIIEETYRNTVPGKKTMETSTPGGGKDVSLDMDKAQKDPEYRREVLANPTLKKEYNKKMLDRLSNSI